MSNTVITNYTDLNGPSSKTDSSVVVIVNKDGSLSVDQNLLGTLMGSDGSQTAGISVVRVGHEGRPDDATDSENEDDKVPHVTLSVDSYYDEPNSIIKYDSGAEMLQSLRIETRENSLVGFHNDHCYTPLKSPSETISQVNETFKGFDDPVIEITHTPPPKPVSTTPKKITILEQQIIPKGKKIVINPADAAAILKGKDVLNKPLPVLSKSKNVTEIEKISEVESKIEENTESSSVCSSGDSMADRDSDSDYKDAKDKPIAPKLRKNKTKPLILKAIPTKGLKQVPKIISRLKPIQKTIIRKENKEKTLNKVLTLERLQPNIEDSPTKETQVVNTEVPTAVTDQNKIVPKQVQKIIKKEKKTPAHVSALLSDMTSLFSSPDVIRRVSTDAKTPSKPEKELNNSIKKASAKDNEANEDKVLLSDVMKTPDNTDKTKIKVTKTYLKSKERNTTPVEKTTKGYDPIPQLDDASLAQILQDQQPIKSQASISTANVINSPSLAGPLSPTLDLLGGLQPEEDGLTEDLLMHVAQLVESSENLQEVIDKQVLGKVDSAPTKTQMTSAFQQQVQLPLQTPQQMQLQAASNLYNQNAAKTGKNVIVRKDPIEIVRRDGRIITLPPIEAPATRASKRKSQVDTSISGDTATSTSISTHLNSSPEPQVVQHIARQYTNKKLTSKRQELQQQQLQIPAIEKISAESQESWNSEDDPNRLWCICKQPHNNRFMICCDGCEDWFHGKCVNITKAMGQQMEEQGIEWRCPNCKNNKSKILNKSLSLDNTSELETQQSQYTPAKESLKNHCIVCKKPARASSIYCSDACILKHAQDSLGTQSTQSKVESFGGKASEKSESRVIVYERKSGRLLAGPNAPTAENLKTWLQKNPTFEVVRPGALSAIKPNLSQKEKVLVKKKLIKASMEPNKIQTTLNFARIPRKSSEQVSPGVKNVPEIKEKSVKPILSPKEEIKITLQPKTPTTPKLQIKMIDTPKASTSKATSELKKPVRSAVRSQPANEKAPLASPLTPRRKDTHEPRKMNSVEPIRDNVRKALQEQMSARMAESDGPKFTEDEIQQFAYDTENELHELFSRDVGMKYKAKYRSLMFNIKDRKNLTLWEKICDRSITPKQLVRLSPEELASQELAQWRDKEAKHQLELIKKSELDLLAASKTYVLKTHKGEEVMENKESVSTELDPNVPVEDVVQALNESVAEEPLSNAKTSDKKSESLGKKSTGKKKDKDSNSRHSRRGEYKRDHGKKKSRPSRRKSEIKDKEDRSTRKSRKKSTRSRSESKDRSKKESSKEKSVSRDRSRHRSRSRVKSKRYSKEHSRSSSRPRDRSQSNERAKRRSRSKESPKRSRRSRSQHRISSDDKNLHRSKSQEAVYSKSKNDSTDSESVERPKSATLKEVHPEYDPHEPMITSAFSEEDLRKSREDVYEESYKSEIGDFGDGGYEPSKSFSIDTNEILPPTPYVNKRDKVTVTEAESDQEPSSTVENSAATVWNGCINMVDVARFYVAAHEVSGNGVDLEEDLSTELDIVGRINPDTVWDYINKMKRASNKDIIVLRLQAANDEEMMQYIALYSYLSSRNRLGVVKVTNTATVKDFYIVPLPANTSLPAVLLPFDGPGLGDVKTHLLVAIIIRQRKKRAGPPIPKDIIPAKVVRESRKRSYTPPLAAAGSYTPPASPRRRALPLPATYSSPALSTSIKDKIAATLASADDDEAYSPGSSTSSGSAPAPPAHVLRSKMEELNRQIEEQKQQILKMAQADSSIEEDEAYSPSRPMTPPQPSIVPLADIALPSNLQEILATIKQRSENPTGDVDMRQLT